MMEESRGLHCYEHCEEWSQKGTNFSSIVAHTDFEAATQTTTLYVAGSDKMLKEAIKVLLPSFAPFRS